MRSSTHTTPAERRRHRAQVELELDATDRDLGSLTRAVHSAGDDISSTTRAFDKLLDRRLDLMRERDRLAS